MLLGSRTKGRGSFSTLSLGLHGFFSWYCAFIPQPKNLHARTVAGSHLPIVGSVTMCACQNVVCCGLAICPGCSPAFCQKRAGLGAPADSHDPGWEEVGRDSE